MNIGVVVAGGVAKGAYEIGALRALSEMIPMDQIKYVSGASIGVINSYGFATGQLDFGIKMWKSFCEDNSRQFFTQVLRSKNLQDIIQTLTEKKPPLQTTLIGNLYDAKRRTLIYKNLSAVPPEQMRSFLQASVALPFCTKPVTIGDSVFYDGAIIDIIPIFPMTKLDLDYIICMYFDSEAYIFENPEFDSKVIKLTFPIVNFVRQATVFEKESINEMIRVGYAHTKKVLRPYFANGWDNLETIKSVIAATQASKPRRTRITDDLIVTNLNKIALKFAKRKIEF